MKRLSAITRRQALGGLAAGALVPGAWAAPDTPAVQPILSPWQVGGLDIHHIANGQGSATLVLMPDGTSLLIDAGATASAPEFTAAPRPDASRRAGQWVARYVGRQLRAAGLASLDYLLVTHLHPDHIGDVRDSNPVAEGGRYRLTGVSDVAAMLPVGTVIDRGFPDYAYPLVETAGFASNYREFVRARVEQGQAVERFQVGSRAQFKPMGHRRGPGEFGVHNLAANGQVWAGDGRPPLSLFPPLDGLPRRLYPTENMCSTAIHIHSGRFAYFTAGDLTSNTQFGEFPWRDVLTPAADAAGLVDVATADHHGLFDSLTPEVARRLRPQAWIVPTWHVSHPSVQQLEIMLSELLRPEPRDVFATHITRENHLMHGRLIRQLRSTEGHVVVRVAPGGESFRIVVTDNRDELDTVLASFGPYTSQGGGALPAQPHRHTKKMP